MVPELPVPSAETWAEFAGALYSSTRQFVTISPVPKFRTKAVCINLISILVLQSTNPNRSGILSMLVPVVPAATKFSRILCRINMRICSG